MNPTRLILLALAAIATLTAGFGQDAAKWTLLNGKAAAEVAGPSITLPPDSQLVRGAPAGDFSLAIKSQPVISLAASSWPVVVVGDLALAIFEVEGEAAVSVFRGDEIAHFFAPGVLLDRSGRTAAPLSLSFEFTAAGAKVAVNGESHFVEGFTISADAGIDLTAGSHAPWILDRVSLDRPAGPGSTAEPANVPANLGESGPDRVRLDTEAPANDGTQRERQDRDSRVSEIREQTADETKALSVSTLEVFTPPAVRKARVEAVREQLKLRK